MPIWEKKAYKRVLIREKYPPKRSSTHPPRLIFETTDGALFLGQSEQVLKALNHELIGKTQLILTSPPFPLKKKKRYGNLTGQAYIDWLSSFAPLFANLLTDDGSIVIELGNAWEPNEPVQSLLPVKSLLAFVENKKANLNRGNVPFVLFVPFISSVTAEPQSRR